MTATGDEAEQLQEKVFSGEHFVEGSESIVRQKTPRKGLGSFRMRSFTRRSRKLLKKKSPRGEKKTKPREMAPTRSTNVRREGRMHAHVCQAASYVCVCVYKRASGRSLACQLRDFRQREQKCLLYHFVVCFEQELLNGVIQRDAWCIRNRAAPLPPLPLEISEKRLLTPFSFFFGHPRLFLLRPLSLGGRGGWHRLVSVFTPSGRAARADPPRMYRNITRVLDKPPPPFFFPAHRKKTCRSGVMRDSARNAKTSPKLWERNITQGCFVFTNLSARDSPPTRVFGAGGGVQ